MRMHGCFISLPLPHYHDSSNGNPHSAHTDCSVEFLIPVSQHVNSVPSLVSSLQNFKSNLCIHICFVPIQYVIHPPSITPSFHPLFLHHSAEGSLCCNTLCTADSEMDLAFLTLCCNKVCAIVLSLIQPRIMSIDNE